MIHLIPSVSNQTIKILPREYTTSIVLLLRDDSTNSETYLELPTSVVNGNYLDITSVFTLVEGRFYDLVVYKVELGYVLASLTELDVIYKDKIFCTAQNLDQNTNTFYTPNESEYIEQSANNDFIIYD
jgi:hypothetical protein